ncbi:MAG: protein translocase SEC61 complex subunit gamma [Nanoarchaeota archaeon]|nr:protein translocase SEC61 complex subunit gamma [Nanoarchaeota archaeon]
MIKKYWIKFKSFLIECKRVFHVTKKPSNEEFKTIVKVTAIGAAVIGVIGAIIQVGYQLIK